MARKGQSLVSGVVGLVLAVIVVLGVALPLVTSSYSTTVNAVTDEQESVNAPLPDLIQADNVGNGLVSGSVTVKYYNSTGDGSNTTLSSSDYTVDLATGEVNVTSVPAGVTVEDGDTWLLTYEWKPDNYVESDITRLILDQLDLVLLLLLIVFAFRVLRSATG